MMRDAFRTLVLGLSLVAGGLLNAQTRFRLADPQSLSGAGNGWAVDQATGALSFAIPIATAPGEIPIPAVFHMATSHSAQQQNSWTSEIIGKRAYWTLDTTILHRPVLGTLHFGYIDNGGSVGGVTTSATYVLEDGTQFASTDWTAFTNYNSTFTLSQDFGLAPVPVGSVQISSTRSHAQYTTTAAGLGATISTMLQGVVPVGHAVPTQYRVVLDKDRARVMGFLSGLNAWAPLLWLDRFGHQVTFKWTMNTTGLPVGATALHGVVVSNQRAGQPARGLQVQWATWASGDVEQDLLRADFIGIDAPSILVRGYSGQPTLVPVGFAYSPGTMGDAIATASVSGVIGRPTVIQVGQSSGVSQPSWAGSGAALPQVPPIRQPPVAPPPRVWSIAYDANRAAITDFTDATGVTTHFEYGSATYPYGYAQGGRPLIGPLWKHGVVATTSIDSQQDPASLTIPQLKRTWVRSAVVSNSWTTTYQEWWPSVGLPERKVELGFGSATQPVHYGNAKLALRRLLSLDGVTEYAKTVYTLDVGGLTGDESITSGIEVSRQGEATYREGYGYLNGRTNVRNRFVGPSNSVVGGETPLEQTNIVYDIKLDKLDFARPTSVTVARTDGAGITLVPIKVSKADYDATTRLPRKTYLDGGTDGQLGQSYTFDTEGRLWTQANFASFTTDGVATTTVGYGADGYPASATTSYTRPANQTGAASVSQGATYDSAGRTITQTDALGVTTTLQYDTLGRLTYRGRPGESASTYSYSGERYRTITKNGRMTTELTDGFGRPVRRTLPDGRRVEFIYDAHGRRVIQKEFNTTGGASRSSSTSYDPLDRPTGASSPGGSSQTIAYNTSADGRLSIVTTSVAGVNVAREECRDVLGQVVRTVERTGATTNMTYDGAGNLKTVVTSSPGILGITQTRSFMSNSLGLLTAKTEPETGTETFDTFNALGRPTVITEASGTPDARTRYFYYDGLGRVCRLIPTSGAAVETYFEGALMTGALGFSTNPVRMAFTYKTASEGRRLASESTTLGGVPTALAYTYLGTGQLDTITYPSGRLVGYIYDADGHITGIQDRTGGGSTAIVSNVTFNDWGQRQRLTFGSTAYSDWSTQNLGTHLSDWTIGYTTGGLGDPANPRSHTYDLAERLTKAGEWQNILHDSASRLGHAEAPALGVTAVDLNHDVFGNNISHVTSGASASSFNNFSFPVLPGNQLPGGASGWAINGRGEATAMNQGTSTTQAMGLVWDTLGRLAQVNTNFGTVQSYTYAPSGLRIQVQDTAAPANNRRYAYTSGGLLMSEYTDAGWKRDVVYLGSEAIAEIDTAGIHELHKDHLGTPRIITNGSSAQIEGKQAFGPYGEYLQGQAVGYKPITGYTGHLQNDASGLIYMRGRFYSPAWHRFVNSDQGVDPSSWNQMAYVGGSPFMRTDPSGMIAAYCDGAALIGIDDGGNHSIIGQCSGGGGGGGGVMIGGTMYDLGSGNGGAVNISVWMQGSSVGVQLPNGAYSSNEEPGYWENVSVYLGNPDNSLRQPAIAVATDIIGFIPGGRYIGAALNIANDKSKANVLVNGMSQLPGIGQAVGAGNLVSDAGLLAGTFFQQYILAPMFNAAPPQMIDDGNGHLIPNPALMDDYTMFH